MSEKQTTGRLWIRLMKKHRVARDLTVPCMREDPVSGLREALSQLDLGQPLWLPRHYADWEEYALTRFLPEHFVESVSFESMDISYLFPDEEEKPARRRSPSEEA